ncbi:MAG: hypothetical protein ACYS15_10435 [Planctomycetota bacterium]|jgi:hypothetical protein
MHLEFRGSSVARVGALLTMLTAAALVPLLDRWYFFYVFDWMVLLVLATGTLSLLYTLPLYPIVRSLAPKRVGLGWALVLVIVLTGIFMPLLALVVGADTAFMQAPLLAWAAFSLGAIVLLPDNGVVRGVCDPCGYDLTGNETGVCPECGQPAGNPDHVSITRRWRGSLPAQLKRWAVAVAFSLLLVMTAPLAVHVLEESLYCRIPGPGSILRSQLQTIRSQIELYNVRNPACPYDAGGAADGFGGRSLEKFWDPLIQGGYLRAAPRNPLTPNPDGNDPTAVAVAAAVNGAWVWAESDPDDSSTLNLYAVDEDGNLYSDPDTGRPY